MTGLEWRVSKAPVAYDQAVAEMEARVQAIEAGLAPELIWLLEHPPLYTGGTSADESELLDPGGLPVYRSGRGGRYTYHGPGQRVVYVLADLRMRGRDVKAHICRLENWLIAVLAALGVKGERREGRVGIWVEHQNKEEKIGAIGVRVRRWITYHGLSLNVSPNLDHFKGIVPCGLDAYGVTSLKALGHDLEMKQVDETFRVTVTRFFGSPNGASEDQ